MNYIYLDTSHLLKWFDGSLPLNVINKLNTIFSDEKNRLVISSSHLKEVTNRTDRDKIVGFFKFIKDINCFQPYERSDLFKLELDNAHAEFKGFNKKEMPFVKMDMDLMSDNAIDKLVDDYSIEQLNRASADGLVKSTVLSARDISKTLNKAQFTARIIRTLKERIKLEIANQKMQLGSDYNNFIEFIESRKNLVLSLKISYIMTSMLNRDVLLNVSLNDWIDIEHINILPYVNYFSMDRGAYSKLTGVVKTYDLSISTKYGHNVEELLLNF